jgi:hypothetical protein
MRASRLWEVRYVGSLVRLLPRLGLLCLVLGGWSPETARAQTVASPVTVRLWATREGLVGRTTASGHVIQPNDQFVALPSRRALGKTVIVKYRDKTITTTVKDVGPWNRDDAWWEVGAARGQFPDVPRFVPQAWAAYEHGHNDGRDGTNRYVTFPAMIDLADGTYAELGLPYADWVDVTLTWVDGPSPAPLAPPDRKLIKRADPSGPSPAQHPPGIAHDERYFNETGFRIDHDAIWSYFGARGRVPVFGFPVSRPFVLLGCTVQIFQRQIAQACDGKPVTLMNLMDPEIFPYEKINGSALPAPDASLKAETPSVAAPAYGSAIVDFVRDQAPDNFEGQTVAFSKTFFGQIPAAVSGTDNPLVNLEIWGAPISKPQRDPANHNFIYQRFQRGIMHFDAATGRTQGLLLADYVKSVLRGKELPSDLAGAARESKYFGQYCPTSVRWICRPAYLPATDLTFAFEPG